MNLKKKTCTSSSWAQIVKIALTPLKEAPSVQKRWSVELMSKSWIGNLARSCCKIGQIINEIKKRLKERKNPGISAYLDVRLISFLDVDSRDEAISNLIHLLQSYNKLKNRQAFHKAILERENIISTGIGLGIAIPHAKLEEYSEFFIAIGIQRGEGIEWGSFDNSLVRLIFLIGGPENRQIEYLKLLSYLTAAIRNEERREKILKAKRGQEVIDLLKNYRIDGSAELQKKTFF